MCFYTPCLDPFLPHDKISMLPLKLMEIHGFFPGVFLQMSSVTACSYQQAVNGWSLCLWAAGNRWEGRQGMKVGWWPKKESWLEAKCQLGFVNGLCSLLELFIKALELCFSLLLVFVLSFPQFANEILKSTGTGSWMAAQSNIPRTFTLRAFEDWETLEVKNVPLGKAYRRPGHCSGFSVSCSSLLQISVLHP